MRRCLLAKGSKSTLRRWAVIKMASTRAKAKGEVVSVQVPTISQKDFARLEAARFMPVIRWVDFGSTSDRALKTVEALTLLDRREKK